MLPTVRHQKRSQAVIDCGNSFVPSLLDFASSVHTVNKNDLAPDLFFCPIEKSS